MSHIGSTPLVSRKNYHVILQKKSFLKDILYLLSFLKKVVSVSFLNTVFNCFTVIQPEKYTRPFFFLFTEIVNFR